MQQLSKNACIFYAKKINFQSSRSERSKQDLVEVGAIHMHIVVQLSLLIQ